MPESLAAEALHRTKHSVCGSLSLFDFEPGQYECSMGIFPVAGPDTRQQLLTQPLNSAAVSDVCHPPRVSFDPPGCGSGMRVPALPEPCCHHGAQGGRLPVSLSGFPAVPLQRLSIFLHKFDRQVTFSPAFLPGHGWQTPQRFQTRKDTERGCTRCVQSYFSCLDSSWLFNSCCTVVGTGSFSFEVVLRRRMGALCPYPSLFLPNLLRPYLLRPDYGFSLSESRRSE